MFKHVILAAPWGTSQGVESRRGCVLALHQRRWTCRNTTAKLWPHTGVTHCEGHPKGRPAAQEGRLRQRTGGGASVLESLQVPRAAHTSKSSLASRVCTGSKGDTVDRRDWLTPFIYLLIYNMYLVIVAMVQMWRSEDGSQVTSLLPCGFWDLNSGCQGLVVSA